VVLMFEVEGRQIYVTSGKNSQTVNVCTSENERGRYDSVFRLTPPVAGLERRLVERGFSSIQSLVDSLIEDGAASEGGRTPSAGASVRPAIERVRRIKRDDGGSEWEDLAVECLEKGIDTLLREFVAYPYLHRVEHSIHAEFYRILAASRRLSQIIQGQGFSTQPVHKEWPEWAPRPEKGNRRGNFDIGILAPRSIEQATVNDRPYGAIR
jgi:hypothetical protein